MLNFSAVAAQCTPPLWIALDLWWPVIRSPVGYCMASPVCRKHSSWHKWRTFNYVPRVLSGFPPCKHPSFILMPIARVPRSFYRQRRVTSTARLLCKLLPHNGWRRTSSSGDGPASTRAIKSRQATCYLMLSYCFSLGATMLLSGWPST